MLYTYFRKREKPVRRRSSFHISGKICKLYTYLRKTTMNALYLSQDTSPLDISHPCRYNKPRGERTHPTLSPFERRTAAARGKCFVYITGKSPRQLCRYLRKARGTCSVDISGNDKIPKQGRRYFHVSGNLSCSFDVSGKQTTRALSMVPPPGMGGAQKRVSLQPAIDAPEVMP